MPRNIRLVHQNGKVIVLKTNQFKRLPNNSYSLDFSSLKLQKGIWTFTLPDGSSIQFEIR